MTGYELARRTRGTAWDIVTDDNLPHWMGRLTDDTPADHSGTAWQVVYTFSDATERVSIVSQTATTDAPAAGTAGTPS